MKKKTHTRRTADLKAENELKALDLELSYGAQMMHISDDAAPEIIAAWLDNVKRYEEQYANPPKIPVYEFIRKPELKPLDSLKPEEIEPEIERLLATLQEKCVLTDRPEHLSPQRYYQFLTEEFMQHLMTDHAAPGMMHFFNYEEFHHDSPEFIQQHVSEFLLDLLNLGRDFEGLWLSEHCRDDHDAISKAEVMLRCNTFRAGYNDLRPIGFQADKAETHNGTMYLFFGIKWEGIPLHGTPQQHEGLGGAQLGWDDGEWLVQVVNMPGFAFYPTLFGIQNS